MRIEKGRTYKTESGYFVLILTNANDYGIYRAKPLTEKIRAVRLNYHMNGEVHSYIDRNGRIEELSEHRLPRKGLRLVAELPDYKQALKAAEEL